MIVYKPEEITSAKLIASTLFETAPVAYAAGTTYALDAYVAVAGTLGRIDIYKSLQAGNTNNSPAVSPAWWAWSSFTYDTYNTYTTYPIGHRVIDPATHTVYQSLVLGNINRPFDVVANPPWSVLGPRTYVEPPLAVIGTAYVVGDIRRDTLLLPNPISPSENIAVNEVYKCIIPNTPSGVYFRFNTNWERQISYPVPFVQGSGYNTGRVVINSDGIAYQSNRDGNTAPFDNAKAWQPMGTSNYWAAFDAESSSQSIGAQKIEFTVAPGVVDAVILINAEADLVEITVREGLGGAIIHQASSGVLGNLITDWWEYFHSDLFIDRRQVRFDGLPLSANAHITVTLTGATLALGDLIFSRGREIGLTGWGLQVGIKDFSVIKEDENFGTTTFVKRRNRKRMESREWIKKDQFNRTFSLLSDLTATPCVWVAGDVEELNEALMLKAWYRDFTTEINGKYELYTSLKLEGMT